MPLAFHGEIIRQVGSERGEAEKIVTTLPNTVLRDWYFTVLAVENTADLELQEILGLGRFGPHSTL